MDKTGNFLNKVIPLIKQQTTLDCSLFEKEYKLFTNVDFMEFSNDMFLARDLTSSIIDVDIDSGVCYSGLYLSTNTCSSYKNKINIVRENKKITLDIVKEFVEKEIFIRCENSGYITYFFPNHLFTIDLFDDIEY